MKEIYLTDLDLENYRNFINYRVSNLSPFVNIIIGPNGSGKTNILESISLLAPGRGLKVAKYEEICHKNTPNWRSKFIMQSKLGLAEILMQYHKDSKRIIEYNGSKLPSCELVKICNLIWITPQMDSFFSGPSSIRRKFIDRIAYNFYPQHIKHLTKYEYYQQERIKFITTNGCNRSTGWLSNIEEKLVDEALIINNVRNETLTHMQKAMESLEFDFPKAKLSLSDFDEGVSFTSISKVKYLELLEKYRKKDMYSNKTSIGTHRTDLVVEYTDKNSIAKQCSTGEQKALLISLILASIDSIISTTNSKPLLLLDELFVHLDSERRKELSKYIMNTKIQTFITTTDMIGFDLLKQHANIINL